jgi:hypothetical protein
LARWRAMAASSPSRRRRTAAAGSPAAFAGIRAARRTQA